MRIPPLQCAVLLSLLLGFAGCASSEPDLHLTSLTRHEAYRQPFTHAYSGHKDGDLDVVLIDDAAEKALAGTSTSSPVRQIMHIRVLWNASREIKADQPCTTNASLHWYVLGDPQTRPGEMLEYTGTGFVSFEESDGEADITIRNATLKPSIGRGLTDPVGPSKLEGKIVAVTDDGRVARLLAEVRTATASSAHPAAAKLAPPRADAAH